MVYRRAFWRENSRPRFWDLPDAPGKESNFTSDAHRRGAARMGWPDASKAGLAVSNGRRKMHIRALVRYRIWSDALHPSVRAFPSRAHDEARVLGKVRCLTTISFDFM
jgi:hypothetical protein